MVSVLVVLKLNSMHLCCPLLRLHKVMRIVPPLFVSGQREEKDGKRLIERPASTQEHFQPR